MRMHVLQRLAAGTLFLAGLTAVAAVRTTASQTSLPFADDFEHGLDAWEIVGVDTARLVDSGEPNHGTVLELVPNGDAAAVIKGSESWGRVRVEGEMRFPSKIDNYLGFLYNLTTRGARMDFGLIYVKGNDSYLQVNPHRDFNVSRLVYPELHVDLSGASAVVVGQWHRFALEVDGPVAHLYVGDTATPQVTFGTLELDRGALGLQPRSVGAPVWVDNVRARPIDGLSYSGPPVPAPAYRPGDLLTAWQVAGPYARTDDDLARRPARRALEWRPFATDARGALVSGVVVDYHGPAPVAYFWTRVSAQAAHDTGLLLSTADDLAVWLNGEFQGFFGRQAAAWFDFRTNPAHAPRRVPLALAAGENDIVIRVRGGVYASGGFYAGLEEKTR